MFPRLTRTESVRQTIEAGFEDWLARADRDDPARDRNEFSLADWVAFQATVEGQLMALDREVRDRCRRER